MKEMGLNEFMKLVLNNQLVIMQALISGNCGCTAIGNLMERISATTKILKEE